MRLAEQAGLVFKQTNKRAELVEHFKVHNMDEWRNIIKGDPLSFANVRHPYERQVALKNTYIKV